MEKAEEAAEKVRAYIENLAKKLTDDEYEEYLEELLSIVGELQAAKEED